MDTPKRKSVLRFIVLLGIVSLFVDFTYEGGRSITGPYLAILGVSAAVVGLVFGLGSYSQIQVICMAQIKTVVINSLWEDMMINCMQWDTKIPFPILILLKVRKLWIESFPHIGFLNLIWFYRSI
jgi:hypothetical protein